MTTMRMRSQRSTQSGGDRNVRLLGTLCALSGSALAVVGVIAPSHAYAQGPPRDRSLCTPQMMAAALGDPTAGPRWNGWSPTVANTRFQPADQARLTAEQVPALKL